MVEYLDTKGHERTAKSVRSNTRVLPNKSNIRLQDVQAWFSEHTELFPAIEPAAAAGESGEQKTNTLLGQKRKVDDIYGEDRKKDAAASRTNTVTVPDSIAECTRVFIGNLSFKIDENGLKKAFADCGEITSVQWVTDKDTGKFYGTAFATFDTPEAAKAAVAATGRKIIGRESKVALAPEKVKAGDSHRVMPAMPKMSNKPEGCRTLFMGNLSFNVTEEDIKRTFKDCGEVKVGRQALSSIHHHLCHSNYVTDHAFIMYLSTNEYLCVSV